VLWHCTLVVQARRNAQLGPGGSYPYIRVAHENDMYERSSVGVAMLPVRGNTGHRSSAHDYYDVEEESLREENM
jgi:hypothetical protein